MKKKLIETERLLKVVHDLRTKCPWDKKQTHKTLTRYLLEESYEVIEAIEKGKNRELKEELGDVLLQVALHAEIASEKKRFNFEEVAKEIADKMIRRHPHIYQKQKVLDYKSHMKNWTKLKEKEKPKKSILEGIPKVMPALALSQRYGEIVGSVGFDWKEPKEVLKKIEEELEEVRVEVTRSQKNMDNVEMEIGDLLFAITQLSRHLKIDAESALKKATSKFEKRFNQVEKIMKKKGKRLSDCPQEELEKIWEKVKNQT